MNLIAAAPGIAYNSGKRVMCTPELAKFCVSLSFPLLSRCFGNKSFWAQVSRSISSWCCSSSPFCSFITPGASLTNNRGGYLFIPHLLFIPDPSQKNMVSCKLISHWLTEHYQKVNVCYRGPLIKPMQGSTLLDRAGDQVQRANVPPPQKD